MTNPSGPQNYGVVTPGGSAVCRNFTFTADPNTLCGGTLVATIHFQDGTTDLGNVTYAFNLGVAEPVRISEGFNDITMLVGWFMRNNSQPIGTTGWFQGNVNVFTAQAGPPNSYIAADHSNGSGVATISNWLLTPTITLQAGAQLVFWTRTFASPFPDRLQVRMSTNGSSTNVGTTATDVGDFTTLLLDINPTYTTTGYPTAWTQFTVTLTGLPSTTMGRLAFRYFVENAGPNGANSDYIGIDTVSYVGTPMCCGISAPTIRSAVSRKTHGSAGNFDVDLPLAGQPGVECRSGGGGTNDFTMIVTFAGNVSVTGNPQAEVTLGMGCVGSNGTCAANVTVGGNVVTIPLTNVANAQTINVRINGVNGAGADTPAADVNIPMSILIGDTNGNGAVTSSDVAQTKARIGQTLDATNFRSDVNTSGGINSSDVTLIKQHLP